MATINTTMTETLEKVIKENIKSHFEELTHALLNETKFNFVRKLDILADQCLTTIAKEVETSFKVAGMDDKIIVQFNKKET